jgi:hypothetical protein
MTVKPGTACDPKRDVDGWVETALGWSLTYEWGGEEG